MSRPGGRRHIPRIFPVARWGAAAFTLGLALTACAVSRPEPVACDVEPYLLSVAPPVPPPTGSAATAERPAPSPYERALREIFPGPELRALGRAAPPRTLALSGGGPWGAYGAGFMSRWNEEPGGFPEFSAVTGVSTGALQATFAFLGGASLDRLEALYRRVSNPDIYAPRNPLRALLAANAFNSLDPLRGLIRDEIAANGWIEAVAAEARKAPPRKLFVGVVDLDSGELLAADLTALAADGRLSRAQKITCYSELLVASASVPVAFDPVATQSASPARQRLLVDGGVRAAAFVGASERALATFALQTSREPAAFAGETVVVVNGSMKMCPQTTRGGILNIGARSVSTLVNQNVLNSVANILARRSDGGQCTRYTYVAPSDDLCAVDADTTTFDPAFMNGLADLGRARWDGGAPFESIGACPALTR